MPTIITLHDVALRLLLDVVAAGIIGINRDEHGRPAGLRTNLLVSLAACIAMIQANLLINSVGKAGNSFVVMDTMRLPLGILSGIGFIGAGAIIKRGDLVVGVTTAATLWFVTVMGLCFGGGQIYLGVAAFVLGFLTLAALKRVELQLPREHRGELKLTLPEGGPDDREIEALLRDAGLTLKRKSLVYDERQSGQRVFGWDIAWQGTAVHTDPPSILRDLRKNPGIQKLEFNATP